MPTDPLRLAADLKARETPFALATVVRREPPISARPGDKAVITADGTLTGWVGGSCAESTVLSAALQALADGQPRLLLLHPTPEAERRPGVEVFPMTCHSGGALEIYVEPYLPVPRLVIMGASPIAEALAGLGKVLGYRVYVLDPSATAEQFPAADGVFPGYHPEGVWGGGETFAVVTTMGHFDEEALEAAIAERPDYVAVVASRRRFHEIRGDLMKKGVAAEALERVRNPAGLDIGARLAGEIAVSVLAEIIQVRHSRAAEPVAGAPNAGASSAGVPSAGAPGVEARDASVATDPVCGMTVNRAAAPAMLEHGGTVYYFCCPRCKARFQEDLERHVGR
jgi:xanthine dehydrogenase accessory factor